MPNGYTYDIYEGKDITLQDYMARVGRGMGMFIHQRDESWDAPLRYPSEPGFDGSDYHHKALDNATSELMRWDGLTEEDKYAEWSKYYNEGKVTAAESRAKDAAMRARYEDMIAKVTAVDVTNEPLMESTKKCALDYLTESRDFDCSDDAGKWYEPKDYVGWCIETERKIQWNIDYHTKEIAEDDARNDDRKEYIDAFVRVFGVKVEPARRGLTHCSEVW